MERTNNIAIVSEIERHADVFLPQRDGGLLMQMVKSGVPTNIAERKVFEIDLAAMEGSDLLIAVLDGSHVDEGVAFEIGYAYALGKYCVGLQTDVRRALPTGNNPMIGRSLSLIFRSIPELITWIGRCASGAEKLPMRLNLGSQQRYVDLP
jgi:hypothetical protein